MSRNLKYILEAILFTVWVLVTLFCVTLILYQLHNPLQLEWWMSAVSLLIVGFCSLLIYQNFQYRQRLEQIVEERTASLNKLLHKYLHMTNSLPLGLAIYQHETVSEMNPRMKSWFDDPAELGSQLASHLPTGTENQLTSKKMITLQTRFGRKQMRFSALEMQSATPDPSVLILLEDWTDQLRSEQALRDKTLELERHFATSTDLLSISTLDGSFLYLNPQWERTLGHEIAEMSGQNWQNFVSREDRNKAEEILQKLCEGQPVQNFPIRFVHQDGHDVWLEWKASREGSLIHANVRDISKRMEAEERNRVMREQVARSQKMESIGRLAGGIAHDFNNSLQVIIGNAQLALGDPALSPAKKRQLKDILKAAERSAQLTRQLLGFAMKQHVRADSMILNHTLKKMAPMFQAVLGDQITRVWQLDDTRDSIKIDRGQLEQVCMNLLENAKEAMPKGGTVTIRTRRITLKPGEHPQLYIACEPGEYIAFSIQDTGAGIDPSIRPTLFEPFTTTQDASKGSGLGLATVYGILQQNKGSIQIESSSAGTCIEILLPKEKEQAAKPEPRKPAPSDQKEVLLVDDNPQVLQLTALVLKELKYEVSACKSATDALQMLKTKPQISLLVTDMLMPEMNGQELYEKTLEIQPDMQCVFMSGFSSEVVASAHLQSGKCAFLSKPFSITAFREVLERLLSL